MLHTCTDCGKEYSTFAKACPNCGRPNQQYLQMNSDYLERKKAREMADFDAEESLLHMKAGFFLLAAACLVTFFAMKFGFFGFRFESQSFTEFLVNSTDWISFGFVFFLVFYFGICILFCGNIFLGIFTMFLLVAGLSYFGSMLPQPL